MSTLRHEAISNKEAARFYRQQFGGKLPAGFHWYSISGLTVNTSVFDSSFLIAGDDGLYGIVGFKDEALQHPVLQSQIVPEGA